MDSGQFRHFMDVPSPYFKFLFGRKGETKRRLETETETQLTIPGHGKEGPIVIVGHHRKGVLSAKTRIELLVNSARQKLPSTHFLSLPMNSPEIKDSFQDFKSEVLLHCDGARGLDGTIFQNPDKLHLTLGMLVLLSDAEIKAARSLLQDCQDSIVDPILKAEPLIAQVQGLEYMNDDPGAVDVLYAKLDLLSSSDRLQILVERLVEKFVAAGLMQREHERVKLHMTVINSLMRKDPTGVAVSKGDNKKGPPRESFDATDILKNFGDVDFGEIHLKELHLSKRYTTDDNGYYACEGRLFLP
ncbi:activating signal cointegrator 1 complex subunit 1-like [Liolophura sinensis]|uniref:activating signal cointegrator 1 complex subunit 1-like n=1 Tax=Liolophura sinensis TaxID=3198878 RepID=UPI003158E5A4